MPSARTHTAGPAAGTEAPAHDDARLRQAWNGHVVRRAEPADRPTDHAHRGPSHPCRMAAFSQADRPPDAARPRPASDRRQLRDPQTPQGASLAGQTSRFIMHFTPTSSSWLNLVERFFADLTGDVIRAGSFASVDELVRDINAYLAQRNADPKPYVWRAEGAAILAKIKRARAALDKAAAA